MALPKLLQKLFDDEGKGPKLKPSIIPTKINGQEPDETGEFNLQLSDPDAATRPEILTAVKKVTEASEVTFEPDESLPPVGHNIGEEWVSYTGVIPFGGIPYCGQEVTRETYRDLWEYAQTQGLVKSESEWQSIYSAQGGNVPFYSSGDGSSTFRMPRLVGYVRGASGQSEAGDYVKEGLPNITGYWDIKNSSAQDTLITTNSIISGALSIVDVRSGGQISRSTTTATGGALNFDASESNSIYGSSNHVTPETSVVMFGVYAFGEITNQGALDATTLATGLARVESNVGGLETNKLDKATVHIVETWKNGTSWYRKWSDGWIEQGWRVKVSTNGYSIYTLPVEMRDSNYSAFGNIYDTTSSLTASYAINIGEASTTGFYAKSGSTANNMYVVFLVQGYCA